MTEHQERKLLEGVLKKIERNQTPFITLFWFKLVVWVACVLVLAISLQWYESTGHPAILVGGGVLVGITVGAISLMQVSEKNWSVVKKYVDTSEISNKLNESNT